jgi:preprotein translocase subunit SecD
MTTTKVNHPLRLFWMLLLLISSLIYALPNVYGDDPAITINRKNDQPLNTKVLAKIKPWLQHQHITILKQTNLKEKHSVQLRFATTDLQMKAKDLLATKLGTEHYQITINLAPRTPAWLQKIGATPMKLGLDLRGGVHLLLDVDTNDIIKTRLKSDQRMLQQLLRTQRVHYSGIWRPNHKKRILLAFTSLHKRQQAYDLLVASTDINQNYQITLLPQPKQKTELQLQLKPQTQQDIINYTLDQTINTLNNRINELGVSEASIQRQGKNKISVDLPGIQDMARAKAILGKTATLRFHLLDPNHDALQAAQTGIIPTGSLLLTDEHNRPALLQADPILTGNSITYATATIGERGPIVSIRLGGGGESLFHRATAKNVGQLMAVVYIETVTKKQKNAHGKDMFIRTNKERIISIANIMSPLGNQFQIDGMPSMKSAQDLALLLRSGALAAPVNIVQELTVGASMGQKNIHLGILSLEIGSLLIILFMILYYRLFGLIANTALVFNIILIIMILSLLDATLTLPGIAGIVLTVGMAVDANVLINERIREELRLGMHPLAAIKAGYERAFSTIVDANVTTLIVALILFSLGSGSVKGFAVTLTIGLLASMLTSITFTRTLVDLIYTNPKTKKLSIGI